jgi:Prokaryotic E2 family E
VTLPSADAAYLRSRDVAHEVSVEMGMLCVVLPAWPLPAGYTAASSDLLLRLSSAYPDVCPDMWWFSPEVLRLDGRPISATESREPYLGRVWQRWSRHFNTGQWLAGIDGLESYLALVNQELRRCAQNVA